jgi:hypothetical protein
VRGTRLKAREKTFRDADERRFSGKERDEMNSKNHYSFGQKYLSALICVHPRPIQEFL